MKTLSDISLKAGDRQAIEEAATILRRDFPVAMVVLFGSKARGTADSESDIDLLILTNRILSTSERDAMVDSVFDLQLKWGVVISLLIASQEQWETGSYRVLPIRHEIERDRIAA
jgi:uncharacterized protein